MNYKPNCAFVLVPAWIVNWDIKLTEKKEAAGREDTACHRTTLLVLAQLQSLYDSASRGMWEKKGSAAIFAGRDKLVMSLQTLRATMGEAFTDNEICEALHYLRALGACTFPFETDQMIKRPTEFLCAINFNRAKLEALKAEHEPVLNNPQAVYFPFAYYRKEHNLPFLEYLLSQVLIAGANFPDARIAAAEIGLRCGKGMFRKADVQAAIALLKDQGMVTVADNGDLIVNVAKMEKWLKQLQDQLRPKKTKKAKVIKN